MHNFITNSETEEMIVAAGPKLKRSFMVSSKTANSSHGGDDRVSETTWLNEDMSEAAKRVTARLDGFLDVEATSTLHSELYQGSDRILYNLIIFFCYLYTSKFYWFD